LALEGGRIVLEIPQVAVLETIKEEVETEDNAESLSRSLPESSPLADLSTPQLEVEIVATESERVPTDQDERSGNEDKLLQLIEEVEHSSVASGPSLKSDFIEDDDESRYILPCNSVKNSD